MSKLFITYPLFLNPVYKLKDTDLYNIWDVVQKLGFVPLINLLQPQTPPKQSTIKLNLLAVTFLRIFKELNGQINKSNNDLRPYNQYYWFHIAAVFVLQ